MFYLALAAQSLLFLGWWNSQRKSSSTGDQEEISTEWPSQDPTYPCSTLFTLFVSSWGCLVTSCYVWQQILDFSYWEDYHDFILWRSITSLCNLRVCCYADSRTARQWFTTGHDLLCNSLHFYVPSCSSFLFATISQISRTIQETSDNQIKWKFQQWWVHFHARPSRIHFS